MVPETVDIAKGSPARKETRGTKGEGREEKRSGSGVEVGKAGLVAGGVRREERKRKWDMGARSEENGRGAMQAEKGKRASGGPHWYACVRASLSLVAIL